MQFLFSTALFISAALLFWAQPMVSKMVLPLLGGAPLVWNTCLVFFQAALLGGYLYAHLSSRFLGVKGQAILHCIPVGIAYFTLSSGWIDSTPPVDWPVLWLFQFLLVTIGFPFFVLSATAPMLQRWYGWIRHPGAQNPYFLYAASNLGSFIALFGYPLFLESMLDFDAQRKAWSIGYIGFMLLILGCAVSVWRLNANDITSCSKENTKGDSGQTISNRKRLHWIALAFVPSSLLLGVTNHITTDIAAAPLFWVIPLGLYLLTFVFVFARKLLIRREWMLNAQRYLILPPLVLYMGGLKTVIWLDFPIHLAAFFVFSMVCHGELERTKPHPSRLTEFYLWLSLGGVLGGLFTALIAPAFFNAIVEYPILMIAACVLRPRESVKGSLRNLRLLTCAIVAAILILPIGIMTGNREIALHVGTLSLILVCSFGGVFFFYYLNTPKRIALGLGSFLLAGSLMVQSQQNVLMRDRGFFGVLKVTVDSRNEYHLFYHGTTLHGAQPLDPETTGGGGSAYVFPSKRAVGAVLYICC